ncbi:MAG: hypothetical protein QXO71_11420, partial [Candidatus Jordarchaeaceae archaeon]
MFDRVEIDMQKLYEALEKLCKTPGPTQACVKVSANDPRISDEFPMEKAIREVIKDVNKELKGDKGSEKPRLLIIRHMGNLIIVGGLRELENVNYEEAEIIDADKLINDKSLIEFKTKIKNIPIIFGAHLDEITYLFTNKLSNLMDGAYEILPICNPPKLTEIDVMKPNERLQHIKNNKLEVNVDGKEDGKKVILLIDRLLNSKCKIFG